MARFQKRTNYAPVAAAPIAVVEFSAVERFDRCVEELRKVIPMLEADARRAQQVADAELHGFLTMIASASYDLVAKAGGEKSRRNKDGDIVF